MTTFVFRATQKNALHPTLLRMFENFQSHTALNVFVVETARSEAKQAKNLTSGASMTAHSRHVRSNNQNKMACAIDMAPCDVNGKVIFWKRLDLFQQMNKEMQAAASRLGLVVEWGGNWKTFKDLDHWQLNWKDYP